MPEYEQTTFADQSGSASPGWLPDVDYSVSSGGNAPQPDETGYDTVSGLGLEEMEMTPEDIAMHSRYCYEDRE